MTYEIDHLFVCASIGAPEANLLAAFGLTEGSGNCHEGQGTQNRRFFFRNSMLELLWVANPAEARSDATQRLKLWDRWIGRGQSSSPFGVCLRPSSSGSREPPFSAWEYHPSYLSSELAIQVSEDAPQNEPMWFFVEFGKRPDAVEHTLQERLEHPVGIREMTSAHIVIPDLLESSQTAQAIVEASMLTVTAGPEHLLELTFDGNQCGLQQDLRLSLPLIMRW